MVTEWHAGGLDDKESVLKLAFLGGGLNSAVGYTHYLAARLDGLFEVVAGCFSRDPKINYQTAIRMGVSPDRCYASREELLQREHGVVDAVCVLTPTPDHLDTVIALLEAGFDVICEKALATSVEEAALIEDAVAGSKKRLFVTFNYSGYPMVREAKALIDAGRIGRIQQVFCEMPQESFSRIEANPQDWRRRDYSLPCVSLDLGVHVHQLVYLLTGAGPAGALSAWEGSFGRIKGVIDTVAVTGQNEARALYNLYWGKATSGYANGLKFRVFGDEGSLEWCQSHPELLMINNNRGGRHVLERGQPELCVANEPRYNRFKAGHPAGFVEAFANLYMDFYDGLSCRENHEIANVGVKVAADGLRFLHEVHGRASRCV